jgi:hypothetical protein
MLWVVIPWHVGHDNAMEIPFPEDGHSLRTVLKRQCDGVNRFFPGVLPESQMIIPANERQRHRHDGVPHPQRHLSTSQRRRRRAAAKVVM